MFLKICNLAKYISPKKLSKTKRYHPKLYPQYPIRAERRNENFTCQTAYLPHDPDRPCRPQGGAALASFLKRNCLPKDYINKSSYIHHPSREPKVNQLVLEFKRVMSILKVIFIFNPCVTTNNFRKQLLEGDLVNPMQ